MPRLQVNGVELYYEWHGPAGADVLVLSNGILMSTASWAHQTSVLSQTHRVLLYDCRGQWQSEHPAGPYTMEQHADDLAALLDALAVPSAHIAGASYGAEISLIFGYRHPAKAKSIIAASAASQVDPVLRGIAELWREAALRRDAPLFFQATYPFNFSERWIAANAPALAQARERYTHLDFDAVVALCQAFLGLNITDRLREIHAPTLVITGEEDNLKPRRYSDRIAAEIPHAEYILIPRAGHAVMWEQAAAFNSLLLGFLAKHA